MESITTIKVYNDVKTGLDCFREYKNESYNDVIKKILYIANNIKHNKDLSIETIDAIEKARARIKQGLYVTEDVAKHRLGL